MKNPTDRIGDPDGSAWRAEGFDAREVFLLRCLNANGRLGRPVED